MDRVESKLEAIETLYSQSDLPQAPDVQIAEALLVHIRERFYEA